MKSFRGQLLVASPFLADERFARKVVLVLEHGSKGAVGVILNGDVPEKPAEFFAEKDELGRIDSGGPVSGPIIALHNNRQLGENELPPGMFVAWKHDRLSRLVAQSDGPFRLFSGHAQWSEGQLEDELSAGAWMLLPATHDHVFGRDEQLWVNTLRQVGAAVMRELVGKRHWSGNVQQN